MDMDFSKRCSELKHKIEKKSRELTCRLCNLKTEKEGVEKLYKFISFKSDESLESKIDTFERGELYASLPIDFNDPYDCELSFNFLDNYEYFEQLLISGFNLNRKDSRNFKKDAKNKKEVMKLQKELTQKWNQFKKEIAVCCFTEQVDNFLMWSHYADCYNGICLEYDKNEISDYLLAAVNYTDQLESAIKNITPDDLRRDNYGRLYFGAVKSVFSKQEQWQYEKEWRIVVSVSSKDDKYIHMPIPKKLYIGFKLYSNTDLRKKIIQKAKQLGISEILQTKISSKEYKLIHEPIK